MNPVAMISSQMLPPWFTLWAQCVGPVQAVMTRQVAGIFVRGSPTFSSPWIPPRAMSVNGLTDEATQWYSFSFVVDLDSSGISRRSANRSVVAQFFDLHIFVQDGAQPHAFLGVLWCHLLPVPRVSLHL